MQQTHYRNDIDGLKAIAVLAVLLYHIGSFLCPSGFVGVTIFFVISGYLVTRIIYTRMLNKGFSISEFYNKRLKRLLPAYLVMLLFSWILANLLFPPEWDYVVFNRSLVSSLSYLSNIYLARGTIYFSPDATTKPLLHTWSLSLEMQFYLLFPLFMVLLFRFTKQPKHHLYALFGAIIALLGITYIGVPQLSIYQGYDYYLPHRRFLELFVGAIFGLWSVTGKRLPNNPIYSAITLCLLISTLYLPSEWYKTKGLVLILLPSLLTGYLLLPKREDDSTSRILAHPVPSTVGKMSYSLYLWHWPLLAFARYIYDDIAPTAIIGIVIATALISYLSFRFVEQPMRQKTYSLRASLLYLWLLPLTLVGINQVFPIIKPDPNLDLAPAGIINYQGQDIQGQGFIGDTSQKAEVLIVGNSHCLELGAFFDLLGKREHWSAYAISSYVSPYVLGFRAYNPSYNRYAKERNKIVQKLIDNQEYTTIVMPADWGNEAYTTPTFYKKLSKTLLMLEQKGLTVYMLNAYMQVDKPRYKEYHHRRMGLSFLYPSTGTEDYKGLSYKKQKQNLDRMSAYLAEHHPSVHLVDLSHLIPNELLLEGKPIYRDENHFNRHWVKYLASIYQSPWATMLERQKPH